MNIVSEITLHSKWENNLNQSIRANLIIKETTADPFNNDELNRSGERRPVSVPSVRSFHPFITLFLRLSAYRRRFILIHHCSGGGGGAIYSHLLFETKISLAEDEDDDDSQFRVAVLTIISLGRNLIAVMNPVHNLTSCDFYLSCSIFLVGKGSKRLRKIYQT